MELLYRVLLAAMSWLLAQNYKDKNDKFLFYLWVGNCVMWSVTVLANIITMLMK